LKGKSYWKISLHKGHLQNHWHNKGQLKAKERISWDSWRDPSIVLLIRTPTLAVSPAARWKHQGRRSVDKKEDEISICLFPLLFSPSLSAIIQ
jgi:hypothetical protein